MALDEPTNNEQQERIDSLEAEVRKLRGLIDGHQRLIDEAPADRPNPVHRVIGDQYISVQQDRRNVILRFNETTAQQRFPALAGGGGGGGVTGDCGDFFYTYESYCISRPGMAPLMVDLQRSINTCTLLARTWDMCCVTCDEESGHEYNELDRWDSCVDSGETSESIYLFKQFYDSFVEGGLTDPVIQLDGDGLCYELAARNVTDTPTTFTSIAAVSSCDYEGCAEPLPSECPDVNPSSDPAPWPMSLRIAGYTDGMLGEFQYDNGGGCAACDDSGTNTRWDGSDIDYFVGGNPCIYIKDGTVYIKNGSGEIQPNVTPRVLFVAGEGYYFRLQTPCPASTDFVWRKAFGADPTGGPYTPVPSTDAGTYKTTAGVCIDLLNTFSLESND